MARHLGREGVDAQGAADCARGRAERAGHGGVGGDAAGGDLLEQRVDALLEGGDVGGAHGFFVGLLGGRWVLVDGRGGAVLSWTRGG